MARKINKLIQEGYEILECPYCGKSCEPAKKKPNGDIIYQEHDCDHSGEYSFIIDKNGDLID